MAQPTRRFRLGNFSCSVFENSSEKGNYSTFSIQKSWKKEDGNWENSTALSVNESELRTLAAFINGINSRLISDNTTDSAPI